jgi:hypothetical protein
MKTKFSFLLPRNISHFLWLYNTSEFISCNRNLADEMKTEYHLYQNITQVNLTIPSMRNIVWGLNKFEKHYWLAGGTLLGKFRINCRLHSEILNIYFRLVSSLWFYSLYTRC